MATLVGISLEFSLTRLNDQLRNMSTNRDTITPMSVTILVLIYQKVALAVAIAKATDIVLFANGSDA